LFVQNEHMNKFHAVDDELMAMKPEIYMSMLETAEVVAERYKIYRMNSVRGNRHFRLGSFTSFRASAAHFRSSPESRRSLALQYLSQRANNGLMRCNKFTEIQ
jgi:hypothetical protein